MSNTKRTATDSRNVPSTRSLVASLTSNVVSLHSPTTLGDDGPARHIDVPAALEFMHDDPQAVERWQAHVDACVSCQCLISVLRGPEQVPRLVRRDHFSWGGVTHIINWPLDRWLLLSSDNIDVPELAPIVRAAEALFERRWTGRGLPSECSFRERVERDDVVVVSRGDDGMPTGIMFVRLSDLHDPTYAELGCPAKSIPRSLNIYSVVVDERQRGQATAIKLMLVASSYVAGRAPGLRLRSIAPLVGFRAFVAGLLGASLEPLDCTLPECTREALAGLARAPRLPSLAELLRDTQLGSGTFEQFVGVTPEQWLRACCNEPRQILAARSNATSCAGAAMDALIELLAEYYVCEVQQADPVPDRTPPRRIPVCHVARLHQHGRAEFAGVQAFSNPADHENLYATVAFECTPWSTVLTGAHESTTATI